MLRILFVDDDPRLLAGLHKQLHSLKGEWEMTFVRTGGEALALLRESHQDVVISDQHIPEVDDVENRSQKDVSWPSTVRVILSGQSDEEATLRSIGSAAHDRVCEPANLRSVVQRTVALQRLFENERIRVVVAQMDTLPSAPTLLHQLMAELAKQECSLVRAGEIVSRDVAMTAKILRLVNSAYFSIRSRISDPIIAVRFLGIHTVSSLVMACHIFQHADPRLTAWLNLDHIWHHSLVTSQWAKRIAETETNDRNVIDDAFAAGMLHDVGRIVLAVNFPETYRNLVEQAESGGGTLLELERATLGVTHAEVGAYLMGTWGLGSTIVEAIAFHHTPMECVHRQFAPLTAVHVACMLQKEVTAIGDKDPRGKLDHKYLAASGFLDRLDTWCILREESPSEGSFALD
jgi:HD-like signal output (HDOD) protein